MPVNKLNSIFHGWKNYAFPDASVEKLAKERAEVCGKCDSAVYGTYEKLMKDFSLKEVQGMKCNECGCPLSTKLRSVEEECPLKKW